MNVKELVEEAVSEEGLRSKVLQALGAASMCWNPRPGKQVFDSTLAAEIGEDLISGILELFSEGQLTESPEYKTLKDKKTSLTPEEKKQVVDAGATWSDGRSGVWKAVHNGKTWYGCNTHRAVQIKPTLKGAIKAFEFIKTTA